MTITTKEKKEETHHDIQKADGDARFLSCVTDDVE